MNCYHVEESWILLWFSTSRTELNVRLNMIGRKRWSLSTGNAVAFGLTGTSLNSVKIALHTVSLTLALSLSHVCCTGCLLYITYTLNWLICFYFCSTSKSIHCIICAAYKKTESGQFQEVTSSEIRNHIQCCSEEELDETALIASLDSLLIVFLNFKSIWIKALTMMNTCKFVYFSLVWLILVLQLDFI